MANENLEMLKAKAEMLDEKAKAELDKWAAVLHSGKRVLPTQWGLVGKIQMKAEDTWIIYQSADGPIKMVDGRPVAI